MERPNRVAQLYGYAVCLIAVVVFLASANSFVENLFTAANPLRGGADRFGIQPSVTSFEAYRATVNREARMNGPAASGSQIGSLPDSTLRARYEVQVLDSFGLKGENNECGGIYTKHKPAVNMCFPPLVWQTYDVDFEAAKFDEAGKKIKNAMMTVKHNGVLIHDKAEVDSTTTASGINTITPIGGPIQLQDHGNPIYYRNMWAVRR